MATESITLDPSEVATAGRTSLDLTPWIQSAGVDWGDAQMVAYMSELAVGSSPVDYRLPNRQITIPLSIRDVGGTTFAAARSAIQLKVGQWQNSGGWIKRITSSGGTVFCDVVSAQLHLGGDFMQARASSQADLNASITLEAIPDFYAAEETLSDHTETTAAELIFTETTTNGGDFPLGDRVRIVVDEDQAQNQRGLIWGFRCRNYSSASTAALAYEAEALQALDTATKVAKVGASGGTVVTHGTLSTNWTPVVGTNLGGTTYQTQVGNYRAYARVFTTSGTAVQVRMVYDVGDLVYPTENPAVRCYDGGTFHILNLGEMRLEQPPNTTGYRWQGQIQAAGDAGGESFSVDRVWLQPTESVGALRAPIQSPLGLVTYSARDEFNQTAGNLNAKAAAVGGSWTTSGATTDLAVETTGKTVQRSTTSDSGERVASLGLSVSDIIVSLDFKFSAFPSGSGQLVQGIYARGTGVTAYVQADPAVVGSLSRTLVVNGSVSGQTIPVSLTAGSWYTLRLICSGSVVLAQLYAKGGTTPIATGTASDATSAGSVGIRDSNGGTTAITRNYDNFAAWVPSPDAVVFASKSLELNTLGIARQDTGGTAYGPVSIISGDLPRLPNRSSGGTVEVFIKASRGDLETMSDPGIDDISARVYRRASYLLVP